MARARPAGTRAATAAAVLTGALACAVPAARAGGDTTSFSQAFTATGAEQSLVVPAGIETVHVVAIGGEGADAGIAQGGQGTRVEGDVEVTPGPLFVEVGRTATGPAGGFNGGGSAGLSTNSGGGGGGASDVRTISRTEPGTVESRLLIAAGGGGAGASGSGGYNGGDAGSADDAAYGAPGAGTPEPHFAGGGGGVTAIFDSPGAPGFAGTPDQGVDGEAGGFGTLGLGGDGGDGNAGGGAGGGGGGGLYGGGGGGGGGIDTHFGSPQPEGGGGGGGGASIVGVLGGDDSPAAPGTPPSVTVSYSAPGTSVEGPTGTIESARARKRVVFELTSSIAPQSFECSLDGKPFTPCASPYAKKLRLGRHKLLVTAVDPGTGNADPTPAKAKLKLVRL